MKGSYLQSIIEAYSAVYGGRAWSKMPKLRRDAGVPKRKRDGPKPRTEAAFLRRREMEIKQLEAQNTSDGPASKKVCFRGANIPAEDEALDNAVSHTKIRDAAAKRGAAKAAGVPPASLAKAKADWNKRQLRIKARRWASSGDPACVRWLPSSRRCCSRCRCVGML